ncbi:MAG: ankyrin repeat domain-containing protein [Rickettsiales bacterium]|nr:ankyrin repeat domain-containing protein [Rickettsiales bacterium]MCA0253929.1 ankyrin repeat domain-containing protein [Pseudomonadota bacterium]
MKAKLKSSQIKKAIQQQTTKFENVLQLKGFLEAAYKAKENKTVKLNQQDMDNMRTVLTMSPEVAISKAETNKLNLVLTKFAIFAVQNDFSSAIKLIIDKKLLADIDFPILNLATTLGRNQIVRLLVPHIKLGDLGNADYILSQNEVTKLSPKTEVNDVVLEDPTKQGISLAVKGYSPVHEAARVGNTEALVAMYMQNRAVFDYYSADGFKPFHVAMRFNKFKTAKIMVKMAPRVVDCRMNINDDMFDHPTALYMASTNVLADNSTGKSDDQIMKFLLENGVTVDQLCGKATALVSAVMARNYGAMKMLIQAGAKINKTDKNATSPIAQAVSNDDPKTVGFLLEFGGQDIYDQEGYLEALKLSVLASKPKVFTFLMEKYPDAKMHFSWFYPMLSQKNQEAIEFFHSKLNPEQLEQFGETLPFVIITHRNNNNFRELLEFFMYNPIISPIFKEANYCLETAISLDDSRLFDTVVSLGAQLELLSESFVFSRLLCAISNADEPYLERLISVYKVNINARHADTGATLVHLAAMYGNPNILKLLLANGALFNEYDIGGFTPLVYAMFTGHKECINLLEVALGIRQPDDVAEPDSVLDGQSDEDNAEEEYTPPTEEEEERHSSIAQQIHRIHQGQKSKLKEFSKLQTDKVKEQSWVIKSGNGKPDEQYSESESNSDSGEVFKVFNHTTRKATYFAIPTSLGLEGELLDKFKTALEIGYTSPNGKSGVKVFKKKISKNESVEILYELKIYSTKYGKYRLYNNEKYINADGSELIVFKTLGNHTDVALAAKRSNGIEVYKVDCDLAVPHEGLERVGSVDAQIAGILGEHLGEAEEKFEPKCAGDSPVGEEIVA